MAVKKHAEEILIREAMPEDGSAMMDLIRELAVYEREPEAVTVSNETFLACGFGEHPIWNAFVAEKDGQIIAIALYYLRYSTWKGPYIYLEDIIVTRNRRGNGVGKKLFDRLVMAARAQKIDRIDWQVLNWNEDAIRFYRSLGDVNFDNGWTNCSIRI